MTKRQPRYQVGDIIGGEFRVYQVHMGGMGEVYLCLHEQNKLPFALKTFQGTSPNLRGLFESEVKTWVDLGKHPNIVQCYWMQVLDNTPFMGLEWVAGDEQHGTDLRDWLRRGALDLKQALKFAIDIVRGLVYAGEKSDKPIVHRDLKPDNVLVAGGRLAKITDFGLATIINKANLADEKSENGDFDAGKSRYAGNMVGTPAYMPPEQWRGDVDIDPRADMYAVGCILYEMLTGKMVYIASTINQLRLQHLEAPIPQLINVPSQLNTIISKCLAKHPDNRYPTIQALLDALTGAYQAFTGEILPDMATAEMTAEDYTNRGVTYHNLKLYDLAIADFDKSIGLGSYLPMNYMNRGLSYTGKKQSDNALADFNHALELDANLVLVYYNRGDLYSDLKQYDKALADFNRAISLDPHFAVAYTNRANIYFNLGQYDRAIADFDMAIRINPKYTKAYNNRSAAYQSLGRFSESLADSSMAIQIDPLAAENYYNRANIYFNLGQYDRAIADYDESIRLNPNLSQSYVNRGNCFGRLGQTEKAIMDYTHALQLDPTDTKAYINRGDGYNTIGQFMRAIADLDYAIQLDSTIAMAYNNRGNSYSHLGQNQKALDDFNHALQLDPDFAQAWFNKGAIYANTGRLQESLSYFEKAHHLGHPNALNTIRQVQQMMGNIPVQNDPQIAFEAFQEAASLQAMRQAVTQYPILKDMIQAIQQVIQTQVPPHLKSEFETRLAWLIQIVKGE